MTSSGILLLITAIKIVVLSALLAWVFRKIRSREIARNR